MSKRITHLILEILTIVAFTLLWQEAEEYVEHASHWLLGAAILQRVAYNYVHGNAHELVHRLVHILTSKKVTAFCRYLKLGKEGQ